MANLYTYIIASLPALTFSTACAMNSQKFLQACVGLISKEDEEVLKAILADREMPQTDSFVFKRWQDFDTALRNELARLRSARKRKDPGKHIRGNPYWEASIIHTAMTAYKNISPLEAEKILDEQRWRFLEELNFGHYFDFDFLTIYALKLKIIERWQNIHKAEKEILLEGALN
jgi:hypothetical protein